MKHSSHLVLVFVLVIAAWCAYQYSSSSSETFDEVPKVSEMPTKDAFQRSSNVVSEASKPSEAPEPSDVPDFLTGTAKSSSAWYPYNYWYLTAYPKYLQTWGWGKRGQGCNANPASFYPYQWPWQGRGWQLTGYGRRQG